MLLTSTTEYQHQIFLFVTVEKLQPWALQKQESLGKNFFYSTVINVINIAEENINNLHRKAA